MTVEDFPRPESTLRFMLTSLRLKDVERSGWGRKAGVEEPESVADHTFGVALMAMVYGDAWGLDTCKLLRMAILHDMAEAQTGDLTPEEKIAGWREEREKAMKDIFRDLPAHLHRYYLDLWDEISSGRTKEAVLIRQLDKLEMALEALRLKKKGVESKALREFFQSSRRGVKLAELRKILTLCDPGT